MSTRSMIHQAMLNEWAARIADQKESGLSVSEWCTLNNLTEHKYFYWKRQLKEEAVEQALPEIVPLAMPAVQTGSAGVLDPTSELAGKNGVSYTSFPSNPCARIYLNGISIEIDSSAPEAFIKSLIKAVRHA